MSNFFNQNLLTRSGTFFVSLFLLGGNCRAWSSMTNGWTDFVPSPDTRIVYVSNSSGNDATGTPYLPGDGIVGSDPFNPVGPVLAFRSIVAAEALLRDGYPDWMLLKRGDVWVNESLGHVRKSGRSPSEPLLRASYGSPSQPRPLIQPPLDGQCLYLTDSSHAAFVSLDFTSQPRGPSDDPQGVTIFSANDILFEDVKIQSFKSGIGGGDIGTRLNGITIRRCQILDIYVNGGGGLGIYFTKTDNLLIEETVIDHCGWSETPGVNAPASPFFHNTYLQYDCGPLKLRNNIGARSSSEGFMLRAGGEFSGNLMIMNPIGVGFSAGFNDFSSNPSLVQDNVVLESRIRNPSTESTGLAWGIVLARAHHANVTGNIVAQNTLSRGAESYAYIFDCTDGRPDYGPGGVDHMTFNANIVYNWHGQASIVNTSGLCSHYSLTNNDFQQTEPTVNNIWGGRITLLELNGSLPSFSSFGNNRYYSSNAPEWWMGGGYGPLTLEQWNSNIGDTSSIASRVAYPDPGRNIQTYMASNGGSPNISAFMDRVRSNYKGRWDDRYTSQAVVNYIRDGFGMPPLSANRPPVLNAGPNQTITAPVDTVTLTGNVTDDGLPNPPAQSTSVWSRVSGPGTVTFGNSSSLSTSATFSQPGTYVLRLTASDGALSSSDDVQIVMNRESGSGSGGGANNNRIITETRIVPCSNPQDSAERSRIPVCFDVKESGNVSITIYSRQGKKVRELLNGHRDAGENRMDWDLKDDSGNNVATGTYTAFFSASGIKQRMKVAVIK